MEISIKKADFICSSAFVHQCPKSELPEYAFIGRSNVGKSSLINMLTNRKSLAKISGQPGKTQLVNHFKIDDSWFLVDLPGYGYAKVSKSKRTEWGKLIKNYILKRQELTALFVLIDSRLEPQKIDLAFMQFLGENEIPFLMIFTKIDKINQSKLKLHLEVYQKEMLKTWEDIPQFFVSSAKTAAGKQEILAYITKINAQIQ